MENGRINIDIDTILHTYKNVAIVGLSDTSTKPSYLVAKYLQKVGYNIYPVNPRYDSILGQKCYPDLSSIPDPIEIVDIFRNPEHILPIVEEASKIGGMVIWMQLGVINKSAATAALESGMQVVMDRCMKIEHLRYSQNI